MGSVGLSVAHLNVRSLLPKLNDIDYLLRNYNFDIFCLSETWLSGAVLDNALNINGYTFFRRDRDGRGGGVGIYVRADLHCEYIPCQGDYEQVWVAVKDKGKKYAFGCIYRPPSFTSSIFIVQLEAQLSDLRLNYDFVACAGDANINLLNEEISEAIELTNGLRAVGMLQLISDPTRVTEATATLLDIIAVSDELGVTDSGVINSDISDHDLVFCRLKCESLKPVPFMHTYRDFSQFNYESFFADLRAIPLHHMFHMELEQKLEFFNETLLNLIDCHAPMRTVRIRKPKMPWLTDNIVLLQRLRDEAKTRYKKCRTAGSWIAYFNNLHTRTDKKEMWNTIRGCHIGSKKSKDIPSHLSNVNQINNSFVGGTPDVNINNIKDTILFYSNNSYSDTNTPFDLHTVDEDTVFGIIRSITSKSVGSDGISAQMIELIVPYALPYITHLINSCIIESHFPSQWKSAVVIPIPKIEKPTDFKHLRPISILPTLSKVLEKVISYQFKNFIISNDILPDCQSGFVPGRSCTTALLNVTDDILKAKDGKECTALVLLDFSKAFDVVDHDIVLSMLHYIGGGEEFIRLIKTYLIDRCQCVQVNGLISEPLKLKRGVPQGSVLGPLLFCLYTSMLPKAVNYCKIHMYADDTQLYYNFPFREYEGAAWKINKDLANVSEFAKNHALILNPDKSVVILFGRNVEVEKLKANLILRLNGCNIPIVDQARNLGLVVDNAFRYKQHITKTLSVCFLKLKLLYSFKDIFNLKMKKVLCECFVLSLLNYCIPVYYPCLDSMDRLRVQRVQNACMRYIFRIKKFERISHKLKELTWLNIHWLA
nr:uncharacterized protein LOC111423567 [Onthophagus taurus]